MATVQVQKYISMTSENAGFKHISEQFLSCEVHNRIAETYVNSGNLPTPYFPAGS